LKYRTLQEYKKVLAGLTGLDAKQGGEGMNLISYQEPRRHYKANIREFIPRI
jgi:hypothetical protein